MYKNGGTGVEQMVNFGMSECRERKGSRVECNNHTDDEGTRSLSM